MKLECISCGSERVVSVLGKVSDMCCISTYENEKNGYVPDELGIGGGDHIEFDYCLECGQIQGSFPVMDVEWEEDEE